jgi:WD40 repeat protein/serine/threonine protein kinase
MSPPAHVRSDDSGSTESSSHKASVHISVVQRLAERYGRAVDPGVVLPEEPDPDRPASAAEDSDSSTPMGLFRRLVQSGPGSSRYQVRSEIGRGGMGAVHKVWDDDLRRSLAMKVMHPRKQAGAEESTSTVDPEQLGRFLEEAQITGQLDHPGVVPVHDLGIDERGCVYFTMRLVRGRELREVLDLARNGQEGWTRTKVLGVILKVCEAMAFAHSKGVVHRDLKPANVMVGRFGETYVMDWGLARVLGRHDSHDLRLKKAESPSQVSLVQSVRREAAEIDPDSPLVTMDGDVVGTPSYMAPEQARGQLDRVGPHSDVYSLGGILYYMLTGRAPYVAPEERVSPHTVLNRVLAGPPEPVERFVKDAPIELVAICEKAMTRELETRYAGMLDVAEDIQAFLENRVVRAHERGAAAEFRKWVSRNRPTALAVAGLVALAIASALGFAWQKLQQLDELSVEQQATQAANKTAQEHLATALRNERVAEERRAEADLSAQRAREQEELAQRSSYMANVIAAEFSLRLDDAVEAGKRLAVTDPSQRGWEWRHLFLAADQALHSWTVDQRTPIQSAAFGSDGKRLYGLAQTGFLQHFDLEPGLAQPQRPLLDFSRTLWNPKSRRTVVLSPGGSSLVLLGSDRNVRVYDAATNERQHELAGHTTTVRCGAFVPDGSRFVSGDDEGDWIVWDTATWSAVRRVEGEGVALNAIAASPDGARLATAGDDPVVRVRALAAEGEAVDLLGHELAVNALAWDPQGDLLASGSNDRTAILWDVARGRVQHRMSGHRAAVTSVAFRPDGAELASAAADRTIRLWNRHGEEQRTLLGHLGALRSVAYDPRGDLLLSGGEDGSLRVWDARDGPALTSFGLDGGRQVFALAWDPSGGRLAVGTDLGTILLLDGVAGEPILTLRAHRGRVTSLSWSADGSRIASGSVDKFARVWDVASARQLVSLPEHGKWVSSVALSPDAQVVATGSGDSLVRLFDAHTGEPLRTLQGHADRRGWVNAVAFSPDGRALASGGGDRKVLMWSTQTGEIVRTLQGHTNSVMGLAWSTDGRVLVSTSIDRTARVWEAASGRCLAVATGHDEAIDALALAPDGKRLATGSKDGSVRVWDLATGGSLVTLTYGDDVLAVAFSPDGSRLAVGGRRNEIRVFESSAAEERRDERLRRRSIVAAARARVDELYRTRFRVADVVRALEAESALLPEVRVEALRQARLRGDDPDWLDEISFVELLDPTRGLEAAGLSLGRAEAAAALDDEDARLLVTLGMAQMRTRRFPAAIDSLARAELDTETDAGLQRELARLIFLGEAQAELGHVDEAQASLTAADAVALRLDTRSVEARTEISALLRAELARLASRMRADAGGPGSASD